jgi:hypothetical protein
MRGPRWKVRACAHDATPETLYTVMDSRQSVRLTCIRLVATRADTIQRWLSRGDAIGLEFAQSAASAAGIRRATRLLAGREMPADDTGSLSAVGTGTSDGPQAPQPPQGTTEELRQRHLALTAAASQQYSKSTKLSEQVDSTKVELGVMLASLIKELQQPAVSMQLKAYNDLLLQVQVVITMLHALSDHCCVVWCH